MKTRALKNHAKTPPGVSVGRAAVVTLALFASPAFSGAYIFAGESNGIDLITHPTGYTGTGGQLNLNVCIVPGTANEAAMEQSIRNIIEVYNRLDSTTGNRRPTFLASGVLDFESVALHELGHCLGKAHVNAASESGNPSSLWNYTKATDGINNVLDRAPGVDGIIGSSDDIRLDDVNLHWFLTANNNPFTMDYLTVDTSTYSVDVADLPAGHLFATNGDRDVGATLFNTPNTEAVMQQGTFSREIQRTLTPDGVATIRLGMSGLDETQGTSDDYTINLNYATTGCDITAEFDTGVGLAFCSVGGSFLPGSHIRITTASMFFGEEYMWHFNTTAPCSESISLPQNEWLMFTPPCYLGISTGDTVADILGAGLVYGVNVVIFEYDAVTDSFVQLFGSSELETGGGYFVFTDQAGRSLEFDGQFNGSPDIALQGAGTPMAGGRFNLVGHPYDFAVPWSEVQIIDGPDIQTLAAAVAEDDLSREYNIWVSGSYQTFVDTTPGMVGTLQPGDGIWVEVYKPGIRLRVPSTGVAAPSPPGPPTQLSDSNMETVASARSRRLASEVDEDGSWYVRVVAESGQLRDPGNVFGQLAESSDGKDVHDIEELSPFTSPHLSVVFPHEEWGENNWGYASDYRASTRKPEGEWVFAVRGSEAFSEVTLRLEGPAEILRKGKLRDLESGKLVKTANGPYTFEMISDIHYFSFKIGKR